VIFNTPDLVGETFTKDTHFGFERDVKGMPVYYNHTLQSKDGTGLRNPIGVVKAYEIDDYGIKFELELDRHHKYIEEIQRLIEAKAIGLSSGALSHTAIREGGIIKRWDMGELSLTPIPAMRETVNTVRGVTKSMDMEKKPMENENEENVEVVAKEEEKKEETKQDEPRYTIAELKEKLDSMDTQFKSIMEAMNNAKPSNALHFSTKGGDSDTAGNDIKSLGDYFLAVYRNDTRRLKNIYGVKSLNESSGEDGGYTVPEEFMNRLMQATRDASVIERLATPFPMKNKTLSIPVLKQTGTYVDGQTQYAGGLQWVKTAEGETMTSTQPTFNQITLTAHKQAGYTEVTEELMTDSPLTIESVLTRLVAQSLAYRKDYLYVNGSGAGEPLGFLNKPDILIKVDLTDASPTLSEFAQMRSRLISSSYGKAVWLINPLLSHLLFALDNDAVGFLPNFQGKPVYTFLGMPIEYSEVMPTTVANGGIALVDMGYYAIGQKQGISVKSSEHVSFTKDMITWRFTWRGDGQPWLEDVIQIGSASTETVSPFVISQ
jgi:HK97 family phage major capsid protein